MPENKKIHDSNIAGFYHWPPIWIGEDISDIEVKYTTDADTEIYSESMICGIKVKVSIKGVFVFDFSGWLPGIVTALENWESPILSRMQFMNLLLACFYSAVNNAQKLALDKMFIDYSTYAFTSNFSLAPYQLDCDCRQAAVIKENEKRHKDFMCVHPVISLNALSETIRLTDEALSRDAKDATVLGELLLQAFQLHDTGRYEASHISAWTIIERCMNIIWSSYLDDAENQNTVDKGKSGKKFINSDRRVKLTGRDFTMSIVSEILSLNGLLPYTQYELSCKVRQDRNNWLHKLTPIDKSASLDAINLSRFILKYSGVLDIDVPFHIIGTIPIAYLPGE